MAIDTANKRASAYRFLRPGSGVPTPTGSVDAADWKALLWLYRFGETVAAAGIGRALKMWRIGRR